MKIGKNKLDVTALAMSVGGGVLGASLTNIADTKIAFFSKNPNYSPIAVAGLGVLGLMFAPAKFAPAFEGMTTIAAIEIARTNGLIKGIEDSLGELIPASLMRSDRVYA